MRTPCGRFIGSRSYSLSWAPTFRGCLALPFCILIISQTLRFVKTFLKKKIAGGATRTHIICVADSTDDTSHRWENSTRTSGVAFWQTPRNRRTPSVFYTKSYIFPRRYLARTSSKENGWESPSPSRLEVIAPTFRTFFHSHLFCTLIVSHFKGFVKRFFKLF